MAHDATRDQQAANSEVYQPLDRNSQDIRLLELFPGGWNDPLSCRMFVVSLGDDPYYEALSYAWGKSSLCRPITINGRPRKITENLDRALRRIRQPNRARIMWVDALCIDQSNVGERTHQVNMMGTIFSHTAEALLFIGDYDEGRLLSDTGLPENSGGQLTRAEVVRALDFVTRMSNGHHIALSETEAVSDSLNQTFDALEKLANLPWWSRMWTLQETVLPPNATVVCGSIFTPWSTFSHAAENMTGHHHNCCWLLYERTETIGVLYERVTPIHHLRETHFKKNTVNLIATLATFRHRQASDPRDKVFALLGLRSNATELSIDADYSLSVSHVYESLITKMISSGNSLYPLLRVPESGRRGDLPSWVPDWSAGINETISVNETNILRSCDLFDASGGGVPAIYPSPESVLALKGLVVDEVTMIGSCNENADMESLKRATEQWKELLDYESIKHCQYLGGGTYEDAFWRVLAHDVAWFKREGSSVYLEARRTTPDDPDVFSRVFWGSPGISIFYWRYVRIGRFLVTKKGYIGIGPPDTEIGDHVCIFFGGKVPFVLRNVQSQGPCPSFRYIGHAYVHGIMDGEARKDPANQAEVLWLV